MNYHIGYTCFGRSDFPLAGVGNCPSWWLSFIPQEYSNPLKQC